MSVSTDRGWRRPLVRLLEGPHRWGRVTVAFTRYGITRYTLVLYPPGTNRSGRIRLRLAEAWPTAGLVLGIAVLVVDPFGAEVASLAVAMSGWVLGWLGMRRLTRRERRRVLMLRGVDGGAPGDARWLQEMDALVERLDDADAALADGTCSAVDQELVWSAVYDDAAPRARRWAVGPVLRRRP